MAANFVKYPGESLPLPATSARHGVGVQQEQATAHSEAALCCLQFNHLK
jgi:hypothetical protein